MKYAIILVAIMAAACTSKPSESTAADAVKDLTFVKHANGLCFGVATTINNSGNVNTILTNVPVEACK